MPSPNTAGATEFIDRTTADAFIPEVWSLSALVEREGTTVFGAAVDRSLEKELRVGDKIYRPSISNLGDARTKSTNTAITYTTVTETQTGGGGSGSNHGGVTVDVTTHNYMAIAIESIAKLQTDRDLMAKYSSKMGYSLALAFDAALSDLVDSFSNSVGTLASNNTTSQMYRAIQYLDDADAPNMDRVFIMSPGQAIQLMQHDQFINNDYSRLLTGWDAHPAMEKAYNTSWLGIPMYKSTNVEGSNSSGHDNVLMHREALVAVLQMSPTARHEYDIDYFADKVALEQVYGVLEQRDDHACWIKGH